MDYTVHGILQARILEWITYPFSRGSTQGSTWALLHCRWILYQLRHKGSPSSLEATLATITHSMHYKHIIHTMYNQSILKEISLECSLEGLMLKLKLHFFGQLM